LTLPVEKRTADGGGDLAGSQQVAGFQEAACKAHLPKPGDEVEYFPRHATEYQPASKTREAILQRAAEYAEGSQHAIVDGWFAEVFAAAGQRLSEAAELSRELYAAVLTWRPDPCNKQRCSELDEAEDMFAATLEDQTSRRHAECQDGFVKASAFVDDIGP